jgi:LPXTG-motif cell wall-anchored protein
MPEWKYVKITLTAAQISWSAYKEDGSIYGTPQSAAKETVDGKKCYTVTILNNPGASLPSTGGPGTTFIYILGTMLTGLAGTILALRRKRRAA